MFLKLSQPKRTFIVTMVSFSLISLEIVWTRIFSAEFFYNFAFMILSLAILGLGIGALSLRFFKSLNSENSLFIMIICTAVTALAGPVIALKLNFSFHSLFTDFSMVFRFIIIMIMLIIPFFAGGAALTLIFKDDSKNLDRLYMADLLGASAGVLFSILLMNGFGTPGTVILVPSVILVIALIVSKKSFRIISALFLIVNICLFPWSSQLLHKERKERMPVVYTHWDAMSKIKIYYDEKYPGYKGINIDNAANSPVYKFDGNWDRPDDEKIQFAIDVNYLIKRFDSCKFLSLGAGGGADILQGLQYNVSEAHAVEVNPHINTLMTEGELAEFSGNIYKDPRVKVITEDGRTYIRRFDNTFDIIYSLSSNSFSALASGAFGLAENYLFTVEAFEEYLNSLTDYGFLSMEHQFYMPRIVSEVLIALENQGFEHPENHIAVYDLPQMRRQLLLLSKSPLTEEIIQNAYGTLTKENSDQIHLLYPASELNSDNIINRIIKEGWESVQKDVPMNISPCYDNNPFTAQLGMMKSFNFETLKQANGRTVFSGFPMSKMLILFVLCVVVILILPLNLIPFLKKGKKLRLSQWIYFFMIGAGFMIIEVILIQQFTLFIGTSITTIIAILFTLLLASGLGSRISSNFHPAVPFAVIVLWVLLNITVFRPITYALGGQPLALRIAITIIMLAPLGFFMGMPFPVGGKRVGELIDWGFAVNGMASVIGSTSVLLVAFNYGFNAALIAGACMYIVAFLTLPKGD